MAGGMPSAKVLIGGAAAALAVRVTRSLYGRWRVLPEADRERLAPLAEEAKQRALELRGARDQVRARAELHAASQTLAAALVERAEADAEVGEDEVRLLREDLRLELQRLDEADIRASRGPAPQTHSPD
jgi:hypothetical protein